MKNREKASNTRLSEANGFASAHALILFLFLMILSAWVCSAGLKSAWVSRAARTSKTDLAIIEEVREAAESSLFASHCGTEFEENYDFEIDGRIYTLQAYEGCIEISGNQRLYRIFYDERGLLSMETENLP